MPAGTSLPIELAIGAAPAMVLSANQIGVPFLGNAGFPNPRNPLSAVNGSNWSLIPVDPSSAVVRRVQYVRILNESSAGVLLRETPQAVILPMPAFLLWFDGPLTEGAQYEVQLFGQGVTTGSCDCALFRVMFVRCDAIPRDGRDDRGGILDIANPYVTRDAVRFPPALGTYQITDAGDIGLDKSLEASLRKRLQRRLVSAANDFFHLSDYGVGAKQKRLLTLGFQQRLRSRVRAQMLREPEVLQAEVTVSRPLGTENMLVIRARVKIIGQTEPVDLVAPISLP
jgi:hypothetical protein